MEISRGNKMGNSQCNSTISVGYWLFFTLPDNLHPHFPFRNAVLTWVRSKGDHSKSCVCVCVIPSLLTLARWGITFMPFFIYLVLCTTKKKKSQPAMNLLKIIPGLSLSFQHIKEQPGKSSVQNQVIQPQAVTLSLIYTTTAEFIFPSFWLRVKRGLFSCFWVYLRNTHCKGSFSKGVLLF